jgi:hypothetical protein
VVVVDIVTANECAAVEGDDAALLEAERHELDTNPDVAGPEDCGRLNRGPKH